MIRAVGRDLPSGTVTFLFTDVEGSTKLLHSLGAEAYAAALAEHRRILREAFTRHGGVEVDTQGDAFFVAFPTSEGATRAAEEAQRALADGPIQVRMGIHTGMPHLTAEGYVGADVHRAARIAAAGHGGQVLVSSATAALVGSAGLRDLGEHRLKDFDQPIPLYQLGDENFPPLKTISNTNLPRPASRFVGRERELTNIRGQLTDGARLLTLTGPGGTGKTRLAVEAAAELVPEFRAGVFWVPLAPLRDAALVTQTIADTLGAKGGLEAHIGEREMLLLLDNLEQVVDAAPDIASLVESCPNLRVLTTSRELLRVRGEAEYSVPPLAAPEAVELFCARAQTGPDETVRELCRALENLPLAIELAAARVSVLTPRQILERLSQRLDLLKGGRDADPRQQTLRATIEWSYELLDEPARRLFARLAVFRGGCTLEAAEEVVDADLETLQSLIDKSLLRRRDERFWMLETIRDYAAELLLASEERETIRDRHLDYLIALAERAYEERFALDSKWLPILDEERDNIRAALEWASVRRPQAEAGLAGAVAYYWNWRGYGGEARTQVAGALERYRVRDAIRARALTHYAEIGNILGSSERESLRHVEEALEIWREQRDPLGEGLALEVIGYVQQLAGDDDVSRAALEESIAVRARAGAPELASARAKAGMCALLVSAGDAERAERTATELYELGVKYNARRSKQSALHYLADCPLITGDYEEAERRYVRALAHAQESGILAQRTEELLGVAMSNAGRGDYERAVTLAEAAYAQHRREGRTGRNPRHFWIRFQDRFIGGARARLSADDLGAAERAGREADFDAVVDEVLREAGASTQMMGSS
jgi:predicted ATPase/class 3 adenylate cyclase